MSHETDITTQKSRELTGKHVLAMLVVFFGIIITVSIVFTTLAVQSFRGEDIKQSYRQGVDYIQTLATRTAQTELGWQAAINVVGPVQDRTFIVKVTGADDEPIGGISVTGRLRHPADSTLDRDLVFSQSDDGVARTDLSGLIGQWTVLAVAKNRDGERRFIYHLDL